MAQGAKHPSARTRAHQPGMLAANMRQHAALQQKSARIAVIGLGYVGQPLGLGFAERGRETIGLDIDPAEIAARWA